MNYPRGYPITIGESHPLPPRSKWTRGGMALDSALDPSGALPPPNLNLAKAEQIGARKAQTDQSEPGAISKQHAASLHDLAVAAGANESDLDSFARVLALLSTGGEHGATAQDRGGNGRISRARASKAWNLARDKLSPADLSQFTELLRAMVDPSLPDEDEEAQGQAAGQMATDEKARADFASRWPEISRIKIDTWGVPVPETKRDRQKLQMALDARSGGGAGEFLAGDPELDAMVKRIGRC